MDKQDLEGIGWVRIGFRFGLGAGLAALVFGALGGLAAYIYSHGSAAPPASPPGQAAAPLQPPPKYVAPAPQPAPQATPSIPHAGRLHVQIPPKDSKTCLREARGLIDDNYEVCLKGQDYWTGEPGAEPRKESTAAPALVPDEWAVQLTLAVTRAWVVPPGTSPDLKATANIDMLPSGEVQAAIITQGSGVKAFDDSLLKAINKASPLPLPGDQDAFAPSVDICFSPDARNCQ